MWTVALYHWRQLIQAHGKHLLHVKHSPSRTVVRWRNLETMQIFTMQTLIFWQFYKESVQKPTGNNKAVVNDSRNIHFDGAKHTLKLCPGESSVLKLKVREYLWSLSSQSVCFLFLPIQSFASQQLRVQFVFWLNLMRFSTKYSLGL